MEKDEDDESTLSPELAKLERILSRKQTASLEGIKKDIKLLLENEELIKTTAGYNRGIEKGEL